MLYCAMSVNMAVFLVILTLQITEIVLFIANFSDSSGLVKVGGWIGLITAFVAWYTSFAGVHNSVRTNQLPVGAPMR
jgi:succinate-acetate transporter protein